MKRTTLLFATLLVLLLVSFRASGQEKGFGAGIIIGEPTGFSLKGWLSETNALDAGIAWSFASPSSFHLHADYLWHSFHVFKTTETIPLYYGVGGRIKTGDGHDDTRVGVRVVVGLDYIFRNAPVDIFIEVAPILDFAPKTELNGNGGIGVRLWFR